MSNFISEELVKVKLDNDEWVKMIKELSVNDLNFLADTSSSSIERAINAILRFSKEWNLKNNKGEIVELTKENIEKLNSSAFKILQEYIASIVPNIGKKKGGKELKA